MLSNNALNQSYPCFFTCSVMSQSILCRWQPCVWRPRAVSAAEGAATQAQHQLQQHGIIRPACLQQQQQLGPGCCSCRPAPLHSLQQQRFTLQRPQPGSPRLLLRWQHHRQPWLSSALPICAPATRHCSAGHSRGREQQQQAAGRPALQERQQRWHK